MKNFLRNILLAVWATTAIAQPHKSPVTVSISMQELQGGTACISIEADIAQGWHMYSVEEMSGPTQATLTVEHIKGAELRGALRPATEAVRQYEAMFGSEVYYFERHATLLQDVTLQGGDYEISGYFTYGACNNESCTPPTSVDFSFAGNYAKAQEQTVVEETKETAADSVQTDTIATATQEEGTADNAAAADTAGVPETSTPDADGTSLPWLFVLGFAGGLLALFTPCVWPVIPLTVSFFLKRGAGGQKGVQAALLYGGSIVVIYVTLGVVVTALFGASAMNDLATNAFFNILFFVMLVVFGISFVGGYELTLPYSWAGSVDRKANTVTGPASIFLMAFTLVLVSFSCTGPIVGFLLVEVVTSHIAGPVVGMLGFSTALALPFTLFAMFPTWIKSAPKSGEWMHVVKVALGYVELAFSLKFLSVADMAYGWGILPRRLFILIWIMLSVALVLQMALKFKGAAKLRTCVCIPALCFAVYLTTGLFGAPLKAISAFAPPLPETGRVVHDYDEALALAKTEGKRVFIDFTGYGCVNCRKMEATVFQDERVRKVMETEYVVLRLYVDDKTALDTPVRVNQGGTIRTLRTVGDKWSHLQATRYGAQTQPFYIIVDEEGKAVTEARSYDEDVEAFLHWLK